MSDENIYDKLKEIFGNIPGNLSVLEEQIDVDLQMEYFEFSKKHKDKISAKEIIKQKDNIFAQNISLEDKKSLFVQLANLENVEAYRTIEKYIQNPDHDLREWAILAFQESRMLLESKILNENQVFISTGLGGRGSKLRYFTVFITRPGFELDSLHTRLIKSECEFHFKKIDAEIEELSFSTNYASLVCIIPLEVPIKNLFKDIIFECNQYGNFLQSNFIITNVKCLTNEEIKDFIKNHNYNLEINEQL